MRINPGVPGLGNYVNRIKSGIASHVPIEQAEIPQPVGGVVLFHLLNRGATRRVVIDTDDQLILNDSANEADLYFKMQYLRGGYGSPHIRPGGYACLHPALYRYRWNWRKLRSHAARSHDVYGRSVRHIQNRTSLLSRSSTQDRFDFHGGEAPSGGSPWTRWCHARVCLDPGARRLCCLVAPT